MGFSEDIPVVYENGVFRPEKPLDIPEHSRLRISIHDASGVRRAAGQGSLKEAFDRLRARGLIHSRGWHPTRDELHERG